MAPCPYVWTDYVWTDACAQATYTRIFQTPHYLYPFLPTSASLQAPILHDKGPLSSLCRIGGAFVDGISCPKIKTRHAIRQSRKRPQRCELYICVSSGYLVPISEIRPSVGQVRSTYIFFPRILSEAYQPCVDHSAAAPDGQWKVYCGATKE